MQYPNWYLCINFKSNILNKTKSFKMAAEKVDSAEYPAQRSLTQQGSLNKSADNQEIFMMLRQKGRRDRRESRMFLVDGQICWSNDQASPGGAGSGGLRGKRTSSVGFFGSSMDLSGLGQSIDSSGGGGSGSEEAISYRIKWCRENIIQLKRQTWPMEKKLQVLKASKMFIKQHQGELKQSKQAKDVIASTTAIFDRYWRHFKREFANFLVIITPWEMRIKKIESHFGSVVASYFTFLRWIFWLNLANSLVMVSFVMVPELIENVPDLTGMRKGELGSIQLPGPDGKPAQPPEFNPTLGEMWEFEGFLKFSPIFYGYYSNVEISKSGFWRNPLAFLISAMLTYLFCFFCISRKLSQNTKLSRIGSKDDEYTFCWTVFVGWDFMIGNSETAYNKTSSLVMNLKEGILEEKEQTKDRDWRLIIRRVFANVLTLMLIVASAYVVTLAVQRSENLPEDASLLQKNELQLVMSGIQFMFPPLFDVIGIIEKYHPRKALSWQLGRILFLDFLNFYTLMFSLFGTVDQMGIQLNEVTGNITLFRKNATFYKNLFTTTTTTTTTTIAPETTASELSSTLSSIMQPIEATSTTISSQNGTDAKTLMTGILLASSTIMPPNTSLSNSSESSNPISTTSLFMNSSVANFSPPTTTPISTNYVETITSAIPIIAATLATNQDATTTTTITTESTTTTTSTTTTLPSTKRTNITDDEDYPDLSEVLNKISKRLKRGVEDLSKKKLVEKDRQKRKLLQTTTEVMSDDVVRFDEVEREGSGTSDDLIKRTTVQNKDYPFAKPQIYNAFMPPIHDPYRKATGRTQWTVSIGNDDSDEEEPLEGRLELSKISPTSTSTRRPPKPGFARPIGGGVSRQSNTQRGGRVKMTMKPILNDDADEDLMEPTDTSLLRDPYEVSRQPTSRNTELYSDSLSTEVFFEPTTYTQYTGREGGPDYAIISSESTTPTTLQTDTTLFTTSVGLTPEQSSVQGKSGLGFSTINIGVAQTPSIVGTTIDMNVTPQTTFTSGCTSSINQAANLDDIILASSNSSVSKLKKSGFNASEVSYSDCLEIPEVKYQEILALNETLKEKLKTLCWETMFGQEMVKIVVMDLVMTVISAVSFEFMRACFVRYCNRFFFWDLERGFPGYQDFKLAENVLHLVNNQSTVWMGMFFAPGLPAINTVKLAVLMYVRSWAVLTCNIPHETVFKVSKSNNFYYWILLINLLICILPVAYAVTWIRPSWHCGPFGGECRMYIVVTKLVKSLLPPEANSVFKYLTSPGAVIPILISLILIIYYLASTVSSSKEANKELKAQLKKDKEQESAVPEITNTTVVDSSPTPGPAVLTGPIQQPSTSATTSTPNITGASGTPATVAANLPPAASGNQQTSSGQPISLNPLLSTVSHDSSNQDGESRPKSLLVPPSM